MVTRAERLAEFNSSGQPSSHPCEVLIEDHAGTYVPPFACVFESGAWRNARTGDLIEARVIGWRPIGSAR